ncbi:ATP-binding protein [Sinosporangium album]|nr:ATP-binding protein [Sinosporangium album]
MAGPTTRDRASSLLTADSPGAPQLTRACDRGPHPGTAPRRTPRALLRMDLAGEVASVPLARRRVGTFLAPRVHRRVWEDTLLLVSEVLTNAVLHSDSGLMPYGTITLVVVHRHGVIHVNVTDDGTDAREPRVGEVGADSDNGRGMLLVDRIADRWGTHPCGHGRVVWFEIAEGEP